MVVVLAILLMVNFAGSYWLLNEVKDIEDAKNPIELEKYQKGDHLSGNINIDSMH